MSLRDRIKAMIQMGGPLPLSDYMALCLCDPADGYYTTRIPFGAEGDFITAPEVSQMFGELIGLWAVDLWQKMGAPKRFSLVELGPGRGTMLADLWRATRSFREFQAAAVVVLVEASPRLQEVQATALSKVGLSPSWVPSLAGVLDGPLIVLANEFFDALPIRQYEFDGQGFVERCIGLGADGALAFGLGSGRLDHPGFEAVPQRGDIVEMSLAAESAMAHVAERVVRQGGALLTIDYGYTQSSFGDTFQAVERHRPVDPLKSPGHSDLTAHVNFERLGKVAAGAGAQVHGPVAQGDFLIHLGLLERAGRLGAGQSAQVQEALRAAVERLAGPQEMGDLFKVMAVTSAGLIPAGFQDGGIRICI